jgi:hypothetical protein
LEVAGLDRDQLNTLVLGPDYEGAVDVFRPIVITDLGGLSSPLDDLSHGSYKTLRAQWHVDINAQAFPVAIIDHIEQRVAATILITDHAWSPSGGRWKIASITRETKTKMSKNWHLDFAIAFAWARQDLTQTGDTQKI